MPKITLYSTPFCVYCKMTKEFFKQHNVQYEDKDVASDVKARDEMVKKSGQLGVPVTEIDHHIVVGFDKKTLSELLGIK